MKQAWVIALCLLASVGYGQMKNTGYYPVWSLGTSNFGTANPMYPDQMNFDGLTHVIHFNVQPIQQSPYWRPDTSHTLGTPNTDSLEMFYGYGWRSGSTSYHMIDSLLKYAHLVGCKLILSVGGTWGAGATAMDYITADSGRTQTFVNAAVAFADRNGYDGIETNYEPPSSGAPMLIRVMKRRMTLVMGASAPLLVTACPGGCGSAYPVALQDSIDQFLITLYDMERPIFYGYGTPGTHHAADVSGFNAPLIKPDSATYPALYTYSDSYHDSANGVPNSTGIAYMLAQGYSASKLTAVFPFYGYVFAGLTAPNQDASAFGWSTPPYCFYRDALYSLTKGGTRQWYDNSKVPWITGNATQAIGWQIANAQDFYITYDDTVSIIEKVAWAKALNLGGIGAYELQTGWVYGATPPDPLLRAMVNALGETQQSEFVTRAKLHR